MDQLGARSFEFDLDTGRGTLLLPLDAQGNPSALQSVISDAGFELLGLELEVLGQLRSSPTEPNQPVVETVNGQRFSLIRGESESEQATWTEFVTELDREGTSLWVWGRVHEGSSEPTTLQIIDFEFR